MTITETTGRLYGYEVIKGTINLQILTPVMSCETGRLEESCFTVPFTGSIEQANSLLNDNDTCRRKVKISIEI